nr:UdgX family uracil-DNA binding protein [Candidatus Filomicrobium marinum]
MKHTDLQLRTAEQFSKLAAAEACCRRCSLWKDATQVVPGTGDSHARLMLVGEQPGDREDLDGRPFVGPAGRLLDDALSAAGLSRDTVDLTNSVKHFKHEQRGKRRLHKRPNTYEIDRCRWWLTKELKLVQPRLAIAMGATAFRSMAARPGKISQLRGRLLNDVCEVPIYVTVHPSYLLRTQKKPERDRQYIRFVGDLRLCKQLAGL